MARPSNVQHIVFRGSLSTTEKWSTGYWTNINSNTGTAQQVADGQLTLGSWAAFQSALLACLNAGASLQAVDVYQYRSAGPVTDKGTAAISGGVGTGTGSLAPQTSAVMTLRSATLTRSGRGRMYFPAVGLAITPGTGLFVPAPLNTLRQNLGIMLSQRDVVVVSSTRGASYPVISVDNDIVPDVMRSRVDNLSSPRSSYKLLTA